MKIRSLDKHPQLHIPDWHARFIAQEIWTKALRKHVYTKFHLPRSPKILEVGSGTGAVLSKVTIPNAKKYGFDLNFAYLRFSQSEFSDMVLTNGSGDRLPYKSNTFDLVYCHFLLLWVRDPIQIIREMLRVGKPGGYILVAAEPDYGGRIDYPPALQQLGEAQIRSLQNQGADPFIGRKLKDIAAKAGLQKYDSGILGNESNETFSPPYWESEWQMYQHDLAKELSPGELEKYKQMDLEAYQKGARTLFIPTFYLWAKII